MYKSQLDAKLLSKYDLKSIFLYSSCNFFIEYYCDKIIDSICDKQKQKVKYIYFEEYDFEECKTFLTQPSLFEENNIIVVKTQDTPKNIEDLIKISSSSINSYLIVLFYSNNNFQKEKKHINNLTKAFTKSDDSSFVRFFNPTIKEAVDILEQKAKQINLKITTSSLEYLYNIQNHNIEFSYNELDKLKLLDKQIENEDIKNLCVNLNINDIEDVFYFFLQKKDFVQNAQHIIEHSHNEIEFLTKLSDFILNIILFHLFIKEHGYFDSQAILGVKLPRDIENQKAKLALKYKLDRFVWLFSQIQNLELQLKTAVKIDKHLYLLSKLKDIQLKL